MKEQPVSTSRYIIDQADQLRANEPKHVTVPVSALRDWVSRLKQACETTPVQAVAMEMASLIPDPDAEVVEAMARAMAERHGTDWQDFEWDARTALSAYREATSLVGFDDGQVCPSCLYARKEGVGPCSKNHSEWTERQ